MGAVHSLQFFGSENCCPSLIVHGGAEILKYLSCHLTRISLIEISRHAGCTTGISL
jgi:hypothetical protein